MKQYGLVEVTSGACMVVLGWNLMFCGGEARAPCLLLPDALGPIEAGAAWVGDRVFHGLLDEHCVH